MAFALFYLKNKEILLIKVNAWLSNWQSKIKKFTNNIKIWYKVNLAQKIILGTHGFEIKLWPGRNMGTVSVASISTI